MKKVIFWFIAAVLDLVGSYFVGAFIGKCLGEAISEMQIHQRNEKIFKIYHPNN